MRAEIEHARRAAVCLGDRQAFFGVEVKGELAVAERVAERLEPGIRPSTSPPGDVDMIPEMKTATLKRQMSQPELILATLRASADPWFESSAALHDEVLRIHGVDIKNNSLHPLLSGLKNEGLILRDGQRITLAERVQGRNVVGVGPRFVQ